MSNGQRFVLPFQTVINDIGVPRSGALLNFYLTGSSTRAPTYSNVALTIANTNPVQAGSVAGSVGQFPNIFLDPAITYKTVLTDAGGVEIWTADPVSASSSGGGASGFTTYANIAALRSAAVATPTSLVYVEAYFLNIPTGGGWFAYVSTDTTSPDNGGTIIVDSLGNRFYRLFDGDCLIDYFGAQQDSGVTDNAAAINAALLASPNVAVPAGTSGAYYAVGAALKVFKKSRLIGYGKDSVIKALGSFGTGTPLVANNTAAPASAGARDDGIEIANLTLDANSQTSACLSLVAVTNATLGPLWLLNAQSDGLSISAKASDPTIYSQSVKVDDLYVSTANRYGVNISAGAEIILNSPIVDTGIGGGIIIAAAGSSSLGRNIVVNSPTVRNCGGTATTYGILVDGNGSATWTDTEINGGTISAHTGVGLGYRDVTGLSLTGLRINTTSAVGVGRVSGGSVASTGLRFANVAVSAAGSHGFYLNNESYPSLSGCSAVNCIGDGARLDGTTLHASFSGGVYTLNGGIGINEVNGAVDFTVVQASQRAGNTGAGLALAGTSSYGDGFWQGADITPTTVAAGTQTHTLGFKPKNVRIFLRNTSAELNYTVGAEVPVNSGMGGGHGANAWALNNTTQVGYITGSATIQIEDATTGGTTAIDPTKWKAFIRAYGA